MLSFIRSLIPVSDLSDAIPAYCGDDVYIARDVTGSYWYVVQFDDAGSDVDDWFAADPCHFGPDPA